MVIDGGLAVAALLGSGFGMGALVMAIILARYLSSVERVREVVTKEVALTIATLSRTMKDVGDGDAAAE